MLEQILTYIRENKLFSESDRILAAVSGGPDSVALAHLFYKAGFDFAIAHFNFKLRGKDSDADQRLVEDLAGKLGVRIFVTSADTRQYARKNKLSIEMAARELRYKWFDKLRKHYGFDYIATAHTADDNVETLLINLSRGTGLRGLAGIPKKNGYIVRPLLFARKQQVLDYCRQNNLPFNIDRTNLETRFVRNKIRHRIIPEFEQINPAFVPNVLRTIDNINAALEIISDYVEQQKQRLVVREADRVKISLQGLKRSKHAEFLLFEILREYGFNPDQTAQILKAAEAQPGKMFFSPGYQAVIDRDFLIVTPGTARQNTEIVITPDTREADVGPLILKFDFLPREKINLKVPNTIAQLDADKIVFPLKVRTWKFGDRFVPLGMKGSRKLSDFLKDQKLNLIDKQRHYVVEDAKGRIVYVVGLRIDDRFKITGNTTRVFQILTQYK